MLGCYLAANKEANPLHKLPYAIKQWCLRLFNSYL